LKVCQLLSGIEGSRIAVSQRRRRRSQRSWKKV